MKLQVCLFLLLFMGCGLFSLNDVEEPIGNAQTDPLKLKSIHGDFDFGTYEDLIVAKNLFFRSKSGSYRNSSDFLARLELISNSYDSLSVNWRGSHIELEHVEGKSFELPTRSCDIVINGDTISEEVDCVVIYDKSSTSFKISEWKVVSCEKDISFFNPDFID